MHRDLKIRSKTVKNKELELCYDEQILEKVRNIKRKGKHKQKKERAINYHSDFLNSFIYYFFSSFPFKNR